MPIISGGGSGFTVLGPFTITPATPGLIDPNDYGAIIGPASIPAGTFLRYFATGQTAWNHPCHLSLGIVAVSDPTGTGTYFSPDRLVTSTSAGDGTLVDGDYSYSTAPAPAFDFWFRAVVACRLVAAIYSDNPAVPPTVGNSRIYAFAR